MSNKISRNDPHVPHTRRAPDARGNQSAGSRHDMVSAQKGTEVVGASSETVRRWLELIGAKVAELPDHGPVPLHRNSPTAPLTTSQYFVVTFDAATGEPSSIAEKMHLPSPDRLAQGEAAAVVSFFDVGGLTFVDVEGDLSVRAAALSSQALSVLQYVAGRAPIMPQLGAVVQAGGSGMQVISGSDRVAAHNARYMKAFIKAADALHASIMIEMPYQDIMAINEWLASRFDVRAYKNLFTLLAARVWGEQLCDIFVDEKGQFVAGEMHTDWGHSPRGTGYTHGDRRQAVAAARNVAFCTQDVADGRERSIPLSYEWQGPEGLARHAFDRWFNDPSYVVARQSVVTQEMLSTLMFNGADPRKYRDVLIKHLDHHVIRSSELQRAYDEVRRRMKRASEQKPSRADEVFIMQLEMLLRSEVSDTSVDAMFATAAPFAVIPTVALPLIGLPSGMMGKK